MIHQFLWVIYPYITLTIMIAGLLYRYTYKQIGWGAPSTEILEKKMLRTGSMLFHYGIIFAFIGHVMGILIPIGVYDALGVSDAMYHINAVVGGGIAGLVTWIGLLILIVRRLSHRRLQLKTGRSEWTTLLALFIIVTIGTFFMTIGYNILVGQYNYRLTIGPWFRGVLTFHPDASLMADAPLIFRIHVLLSLALFAIIPFTKLVHFFTLPIRYAFRAPIQYRSRVNYDKGKIR
jgi:nitrate reductase gamma subunit